MCVCVCVHLDLNGERPTEEKSPTSFAHFSIETKKKTEKQEEEEEYLRIDRQE